MKFNLTKEELILEIEKFNSRKDKPYYVAYDLEFSRNLFKTFEHMPGIAGLPASVDNKPIFLYYINSKEIFDAFETIKSSTRKDKLAMRPKDICSLLKKRLCYGTKLFGRELVIRDMIFFYKEGIIPNDFLIRKKVFHNIDKITRLLTTTTLDNILVSSEAIYTKGIVYKHKDLLDTEDYENFYFKAIPYQQIANKKDLRLYLNRKYRELVVLAESINGEILTDKDRVAKRKFVSIIETMLIAFKSEGVRELDIPSNLLIDFLVNFSCTKIKSIENTVLDTILLCEDDLNGIKIHDKSKDYMRNKCVDKGFQNIDIVFEEIRTIKDLEDFIKLYNHRHKQKLYLDLKFSKRLYNVSKDIPNVVPMILYLRKDNRFVVVYQFSSKSMYDAFTCFLEELDSEDSRLSKTDLVAICEKELQSYSYLVFSSQCMISIKYLHKAKLIDSNSFVTNEKNATVTNLATLYRIMPLDEMAISNDLVYLKIRDTYKLRNFKHFIRYDSKGYYTAIKVQTTDCCVIDRLLGDLIKIEDYESSHEFADTCKQLFNKIRKRVKTYISDENKWKIDYVNYKHYYDVCRDKGISNDFINYLDEVFSNKESEDKSIDYVRRLINSAV